MSRLLSKRRVRGVRRKKVIPLIIAASRKGKLKANTPVFVPIGKRGRSRAPFGRGRGRLKGGKLKGGRLKGSTGFSIASTAALIGSTVQPELAPILLPVAGISAGIGRILAAFGAGLKKPKKKKGRKRKPGRPKKRKSVRKRR